MSERHLHQDMSDAERRLSNLVMLGQVAELDAKQARVRVQAGPILTAWLPILYAGVMSCGVAYTLQVVGQKNVNPTVASLILSLESCISVLAGWVLLDQKLSIKELLGCVIMFAAIILTQLPEKEKDNK